MINFLCSGNQSLPDVIQRGALSSRTFIFIVKRRVNLLALYKTSIITKTISSCDGACGRAGTGGSCSGKETASPTPPPRAPHEGRPETGLVWVPARTLSSGYVSGLVSLDPRVCTNDEAGVEPPGMWSRSRVNASRDVNGKAGGRTKWLSDRCHLKNSSEKIVRQESRVVKGKPKIHVCKACQCLFFLNTFLATELTT